jgi:very-short-patch-repair endonuclease
MGFTVARYTNDLVMHDVDSVVADIRKRLLVLRDAPLRDTPSPGGLTTRHFL